MRLRIKLVIITVNWKTEAMFKWKVSRLGGSKKDRTKQKLNNEIEENEENLYGKNNNNNKDR